MVVQEKVASVGDLKDGEMKEVRVGEKKVLLSKVEGQYYASGFLCTHYKAPLAKGTLSKDGRVVCPWHGACFNVKNGDVEDAPGVDALASYQVKIEGDDVIVIADEAALESGRRIPKHVSRGADERVFVIVGGGAAGFTAATTLREEGFLGRVVLVSRENYLPIDRVKLSKGLKVEVDKILLRNKEYFDNAGIEVELGKEITSVNPTEKVVALSDGTSIKFDKLLLATGGDPRFFWGDAKSFSNVFLVRGADDAARIDAAIEAKKDAEVVIVGSSFIGMEAAAAVVKSVKSVTVIGMEKVAFERVLGEKVGGALQKLHEEKGIKFRMGAVVESFDKESDSDRVQTITLKGGEKIASDIIIVGAGVAPATNYLKSSFQLEKDGSLLVDKFLKVSQFEDIYAAGDIARFPYHLNAGHEGTVRIEHWNIAQQHGRVAAKNLLGKNLPFELVPFFWTTQYGKSLRYVGHALSYDDVIIEGSLEELTFVAYYTKGDEILAVSSLGKDPACSNAAELFRLGLMPKASVIKGGKSILDYAAFLPAPPSPKKVVPPASPATGKKPAPKPAPSSGLGNLLPILILALAVGLGYYFYTNRVE